MDAFFNPLLNSAVSAEAVHDQPSHVIEDEALVYVTGRTATAIALPNFQDASRGVGKKTLVRVAGIVNRSTEPVTVSVDGGGTIDGARTVTVGSGQTAWFGARPDPAQPAQTSEYALIIVV